jgi:DDE superfamily endonuclease
MKIPSVAVPVLSIFQPAFSTPTYHRFRGLWLGAILTTGRQTMTNLRRTVSYHAQGHASSSPRVLSPRRWSSGALARLVMACLLTSVVPTGPVFFAADATVAERPGPTVFGKGRHRDGVRSTHSYTAYRWGQTWVVLPMLVKLPFAIRPWALPVLVALYRAPEWDQADGTRHQTPAQMARRLLARAVRWFPERQCICVGDTGYGPSETARFGRKQSGHLTFVSKCYGDAAFYEPPPPRTRTTGGRPRVQGPRMASPREVVANTAPRTRRRVAWSGGSIRDLAVVTGTGHWYRIGAARVEVRGVYVHDRTGSHRDEYVFTTDLRLCPQQIVEGSTQRWSIEPTSQAGREYVKLESTKGDSQPTVLRLTPCLFGLYTLVGRLYLQLPRPLRTLRAVVWTGKSTVTFSAMITCLRRAGWEEWCVHTQADPWAFSQRSQPLQEMILYALAPAA